MAGIGFELRRVYERKTLVSTVQGTFYAVFTITGPAIVLALIILMLKTALELQGTDDNDIKFFLSSITYVFISATLISSIFTQPISRFISDCIYENNEQDIFPSAYGLMSICSIIQGIVMIILCCKIKNAPDGFIFVYYILGILVINSIALMTYASSIKYYKELTISFIAGMIAASIVNISLNNLTDVNNITAACISLVCCYLIVVIALLVLCTRTFGVPSSDYYKFLSYFKKYPELIISGFAYTLSIFICSLIYWRFSTIRESIDIFHIAPSYDSSLFLSTLINTPAMILFIVNVETAFYDRYKLYISSLNGGTLSAINKQQKCMVSTLWNKLAIVYYTQGGVVLAAAYISFSLGLNSVALLSIGIYAIFSMYLAIIVLYYFADYKSANISTLVCLTLTTACAFIACYMKTGYEVPLIAGGVVGWITALLLLNHRMNNITKYLMCKY